MPIEKVLFQIAKDPSVLIESFLEKNPNMAYSTVEIFNGIPEFKKLGIPYEKIRETLANMIRENKIEFAWVHETAYYKTIEEEIV